MSIWHSWQNTLPKHASLASFRTLGGRIWADLGPSGIYLAGHLASIVDSLLRNCRAEVIVFMRGGGWM